MTEAKTGAIQNRWAVAIAGITMQLMLGTVYAWSVFKKPFMTAHGWSGPEVGMAFTIVIFCIGVAAAFGGKFVDKAGARNVATIAAILFGLGTALTGFANHIGNLWMLYICYGLIAGVGNGLGYITPIAVLVRWFPDKRGLITGLAVMGFGLGAALMGQVVPLVLPALGLSKTFVLFGVVFLGILLFAASKLNNPPEGWTPPVPAQQAAKKVSPAMAPKRPQGRSWHVSVLFALGNPVLERDGRDCIVEQSIANGAGTGQGECGSRGDDNLRRIAFQRSGTDFLGILIGQVWKKSSVPVDSRNTSPGVFAPSPGR
jgi:OFA family oxalate/formate antiporter-like MFS transporter